MSVTMTNLILGPATLYIGTFGNATDPGSASVNATPQVSAGWRDAGGTQDGVTLNIDQSYTMLTVDQVVDQAGARLTNRTITVATSFAEATVQNLQDALNGGTVTTGASVDQYDPANDVSATQPAYRVLLFDGWGPSQLRRRVAVKKVLSTAAVGIAYKKDTQTLIPVTFTAFYVDASNGPFKVYDAKS